MNKKAIAAAEKRMRTAVSALTKSLGQCFQEQVHRAFAAPEPSREDAYTLIQIGTALLGASCTSRRHNPALLATPHRTPFLTSPALAQKIAAFSKGRASLPSQHEAAWYGPSPFMTGGKSSDTNLAILTAANMGPVCPTPGYLAFERSFNAASNLFDYSQFCDANDLWDTSPSESDNLQYLMQVAESGPVAKSIVQFILRLHNMPTPALPEMEVKRKTTAKVIEGKLTKALEAVDELYEALLAEGVAAGFPRSMATMLASLNLTRAEMQFSGMTAMIEMDKQSRKPMPSMAGAYMKLMKRMNALQALSILGEFTAAGLNQSQQTVAALETPELESMDIKTMMYLLQAGGANPIA